MQGTTYTYKIWSVLYTNHFLISKFLPTPNKDSNYRNKQIKFSYWQYMGLPSTTKERSGINFSPSYAILQVVIHIMRFSEDNQLRTKR